MHKQFHISSLSVLNFSNIKYRNHENCIFNINYKNVLIDEKFNNHLQPNLHKQIKKIQLTMLNFSITFS